MYSFNLNGFFNSMGWSEIIPSLPLYIAPRIGTSGQYEGFAYLGAGMLLLLLITSLYCMCHLKSVRKTSNIVPFLIIGLLSLVLALSPVITFGEHVILDLSLPTILMRLWEIFRSSGRLIWPMFYLLFIFAISGDRNYINAKVKAGLLIFCLGLQIFDIHQMLRDKHNSYDEIVEYQGMLQDPRWEELAKEHEFEHLVFAYDALSTPPIVYEIANYASTHKMTTNMFLMAHLEGGANPMMENYVLEELRNLNDKTLYVFGGEDNPLVATCDLAYEMLDGIYIGITK